MLIGPTVGGPGAVITPGPEAGLSCAGWSESLRTPDGEARDGTAGLSRVREVRRRKRSGLLNLSLRRPPVAARVLRTVTMPSPAMSKENPPLAPTARL